ncbi:hypothetical protein J0656_19755 [Muricauda ruestringensis]|uniref:Uncharacterized protein n=1 Tax=Flagellimonas aurea TaxID=2915619 RepID=A0ABS3GAE1_9FLAO|nr:hypothetical protein [Allomuricauda aurea]MBO0356263.1 hypothetical protein [Allomuricauda aurea]
MGTLAIGISLIMVIYALFLHITYHYILGNGNFKGLHLNHFFKKLKKLRNLSGNAGHSIPPSLG